VSSRGTTGIRLLRAAEEERHRAMNARGAGLLRATEEELRRAQAHAARLRSVWPPTEQSKRSEELVERCLRLSGAVLQRSALTAAEERNGWRELGLIRAALTGTSSGEVDDEPRPGALADVARRR
jgi:hypothetical protein